MQFVELIVHYSHWDLIKMLKTKHGAQSHPSASTQRSHPHEYGQPGKQGVQYENTYKLEPDATFPSAPIRKIINEILQVKTKLSINIKNLPALM